MSLAEKTRPDLLPILRQRLKRVYAEETVARLLPELRQLLEQYRGMIASREAGWSERDALLITYADSILGDAAPLRTLHHFLQDQVVSSARPHRPPGPPPLGHAHPEGLRN